MHHAPQTKEQGLFAHLCKSEVSHVSPVRTSSTDSTAELRVQPKGSKSLNSFVSCRVQSRKKQSQKYPPLHRLLMRKTIQTSRPSMRRMLLFMTWSRRPSARISPHRFGVTWKGDMNILCVSFCLSSLAFLLWFYGRQALDMDVEHEEKSITNRARDFTKAPWSGRFC